MHNTQRASTNVSASKSGSMHLKSTHLRPNSRGRNILHSASHDSNASQTAKTAIEQVILEVLI
jgi:hypothetical protein